MAGDATTPASTVTRKPDEDVGKPGPAPTAGGHQTAQQAEITGTGSGGRSDEERGSGWGGGEAGRNPAPKGGASQGHSERKKASPDGGPA